ncbi:MAG TPA: SDR family oxidoreductase [Thermomicrobiaceae bacterium]|nr:SDR family oxidoreductase [Thermomicrobiaceae bacterium]
MRPRPWPSRPRASKSSFSQYLRLPRPDGSSESGEGTYHANRAKTADDVVAAIQQAGGQAASLEIDLAEPANVARLLDYAEAAFGPVEILVNNAADAHADTFVPHPGDLANPLPQLWLRDPIPSITAQSIDRHYAVNTRAVALLMTEFARRHVERGASWGRIVNVSTDGASDFPSEVSYGASNYAIESYSRVAASELGQYGITVNIVSPGPIQTGWIGPEHEALAVREIPLGRIGQPEDVADVIVFLASEQARWLTGQLLFVGGGHRME